jgi:ligand-binding sensor domain-containing protein
VDRIRVATVAVLALALCPSADAEPTISATTINQYLKGKNSPMADQGDVFVADGLMHNVDPRLVVAIAGNESSFGTALHIGPFNAWGWRWNSTDPGNSFFASWREGIDTVTKYLRKSYFDPLVRMSIKPSIPAIGAIYCKVSVDPMCANWVPNVTAIYHADLLGDLSDLGFSAPPTTVWLETAGPDFTNSTAVEGLVTTSLGEVFASTALGCFDNNALGVFRSTDHGASWAPLNFGLFGTNVFSLALSNGGNLFAGTRGGVYRYDRTLGTWEPSGLFSGDIVMLVSTKSGLFAADSCFCSNLYQSFDEGATWQPTVGGLSPCINAFVQDDAGNSFAGTGISGVFMLPAGGTAWQAINSGLPTSDVHGLALDAGGNLFMGGPAGLFRLNHGATQWQQLTNGLPVDGFQRIAFGSAGKVFAGTFSNGIYLSNDGGNTWSADNSGIAKLTTVGAFATDSQGYLYTSVGSTVYRSASPVQ